QRRRALPRPGHGRADDGNLRRADGAAGRRLPDRVVWLCADGPALLRDWRCRDGADRLALAPSAVAARRAGQRPLSERVFGRLGASDTAGWLLLALASIGGC